MRTIILRCLKTLPILAWTVSACLAYAQDGNKPISLSKDKPEQGQTIEVKVSAPPGRPYPLVDFNGHSYKTFALEGDKTSDKNSDDRIVYQTLIAVPVDLKPGAYKLSTDGNEVTLNVIPGHFVLQRLSLPKKAAALEPTQAEVKAVEGAKETLSDKRYWSGCFTRPNAARVSTTFGAQRIVNGVREKDYFHSGIDYAGSLGSPIAACAAGKVVLAHTGFPLHGNIVAIDHGQGVVSFYLHMLKINVKEGDMVKQGEVIGKVGQSGRANGPHLHFSLYVNRVSADPNQWYKTAF